MVEPRSDELPGTAVQSEKRLSGILMLRGIGMDKVIKSEEAGERVGLYIILC